MIVGTFLSVSINQRNKATENIEYYSAQVRVMEEDAEFYEDMIQKAGNEDGYYKTTAEFGTKFLSGEYRVTTYDFYFDNPTSIGAYNSYTDSTATWYFLVYKFSAGTEIVKGTTYTQFSSAQYMGMNGQIEVAYTKYNGMWVSMNTSYTLEDNKDYTLAKNNLEEAKISKTNNQRTITTLSIILAVIIGVGVLLVVRSIKKSKEERAKLEEANKQAQAEAEKQRRIQEYGHTCEYCGGTIPNGKTECENCGSKIYDK